MGIPELWVCQLGAIEYRAAMGIQERLRELRQRDELPDVLLLLEHPPVYTRGRRAEPGELPMGDDWYREQGIDVIDTDRGGRVTYHGPGQLVGYPIVRIGDVLEYLRSMEGALIAALADEGIDAGVREGLTGVWVEQRKIASIGVHVSRGVTTHGFAINVDNDLTPFSWVIPCGLSDVTMTSVSAERQRSGALRCIRRHVAHRFAGAYGLRQRLVTPHRLGIEAPAAPAQAAPLGLPA